MLRDTAGRAYDLIGVADDRRLAEHRHLERIVRAAHAGTLNGFENRKRRAFPHGARLQTCDFRLAPPGFAFSEPSLPCAACHCDEDKGADHTPTYSSRHIRR